MKTKHKATLLTLALVPAAVVTVGNSEVQAQEQIQTVKTTMDSWVNPHHIYDAKPMQRVASVSRVAAASVSEEQATSVAELKEAIYKNLRAFNTEFVVNYTGNTAGLSDVASTILKDVQTDQTMVYEAGTISKYSFGGSFTSQQATLTFKLTYHTTAAQEQFVTEEVERISSEIIRTDMTDFEKVKAINDYIVLKTTYSTETTASPHAVYAILKESKGVCQAYALLAYRLLKEAGMEAYYVTGIAGGGPHAWNLVKVDGEWYNLDTTWNDPVFSGGSGDMSHYVGYGYFLISDTVLQQDHVIDPMGYPSATSEKYAALRGVSNPIVVDKTWYFANRDDNQKIYKIDFGNAGPTSQKVADTRAVFLTAQDGWLYFSNYSQGGWLYKMKPDGTELNAISNFQITSLKIENDNLVYTDTSNTVHTTPLKDEATINQEAAAHVTALIAKIVDTAPTYLEDVANARKAYNLLTAAQKALVAEQSLISHETAIKQTNEAIANVIAAIAQLDEYAEDFADKVAAAQGLFNALDVAKQKSVTNSAALTQALSKVENNKQIANALTSDIQAIDVTKATYFASTTAARTQYDQLTAAQKKLIASTVVDKLVAAEAQKAIDEKAVFNINYQLDLVNEESAAFKDVIEPLVASFDALTTVQKTLVTKQSELEALRIVHQTYKAEATIFEAQVAALVSVASANFAKSVQEANTKWNAWNLAQQAYITEATQTALAGYVVQIGADLQTAELVQSQINLISVENTSFVAAVAAARTAYDALTATQQVLVSNIAVLVAHEQAVTKIQAAIAAITAIPAVSTSDFATIYSAAKTAYDSLSNAEKAHVSNGKNYLDAQVAINEASKVTDKISALTSPYEVASVESAKQAYDKLSNLAKSLVTNYSVLQLAEQAIKEEQDTIKVNAVIAQINALATVNESFVANYDAALAAYATLTADQKNLVTNHNILVDLDTVVTTVKATIAAIAQMDAAATTSFVDYKATVQQAADQLAVIDAMYHVAVTNAAAVTAATATIQAVDALNAEIVALTVASSVEQIAAVKASYASLTAQQKAFVTGYEQALQLEDKIAAAAVNHLISLLDEASATFIADVAKAEAAYKNLTDSQRGFVTNYLALQQAIDKVNVLTESTKEVASVIQLIAQINETGAGFETELMNAQQAFATLTEDQKLAVTNAGDLITKEQTLQQYKQDVAGIEGQISSINPAQATFMIDVETVNKAYNTLNAAQRTLIAAAASNMLQQYVTDIVGIRTVDAQLLALNALSTSYYTEVAVAQEAFNALNEHYQALLSPQAVQKLQEAVALVSADQAAAQAVISKISSLMIASASSDVRAARAAYNTLTANQKQLVTNLASLINIEAYQANSGNTGGSPGDTNNSGNTGNTGSTGNSGNAGGTGNTGGTIAPPTPTTPVTPVEPTPVVPSSPQVVQDGNTVKVNVPIAQDATQTEPIEITASETVNITIPVNAIPQGQEGSSVAFAIEQQDGRIQLQATINNEPAKFATYVEIEIANLPENAVLLRIDENGNKVATPFVIKDGKHVIKTMTSGEFIISTEEKTFGDVEKDGHKEYIEALAKRHIVLGASEESFNPNAGISRAQFSTMIARAMGLQPEGKTSFKDVDGKWYADSVQALFEAGIVNGKTESSFDPGQTLTRQQATLMIVRLLEFVGVELPEVDVKSVPFKDFDNIPKNYQDAVAKVYALGIFSGKEDGTFNPSGELTRSQMSKVLYKTLELAGML